MTSFGSTPRRWRRLLVPLLVPLLGLIATRCASGVRYRSAVVDTGRVRYHLEAPGDGFERVVVSDYDLAFAHRERGTMGAHAVCEKFEDVPLKALLNQLLFGTTHRRKRLEEWVTLDGRGALHALYDLSLDGVPVRLEVFVMSKDGCLFDFTYAGSLEGTAAGQAAFHRFVQSFSLLHRRN